MSNWQITLVDVTIVKHTQTHNYSNGDLYRAKAWFEGSIMGRPEEDAEWPMCGTLEMRQKGTDDAAWMKVKVDWQNRKVSWTVSTKDEGISLWNEPMLGDCVCEIKPLRAEPRLPGL